MTLIISIIIISLILFIYCVVNAVSLDNFKVQKDLELKDMVYQTRERFDGCERSNRDLRSDFIDLKYIIPTLEREVQRLHLEIELLKKRKK